MVVARVGSWRFVLGCGNGEILVCKHEKGRQLTKMYQTGPCDSHSAIVTHLSVCGRRLASSSIDKTAAVWDVETASKLAVLSGHTDWVLCVDISDSVVVTGSRRAPFVRVYCIGSGYSCISSFSAAGWVHNNAARSLYIIDRDHLLSASDDNRSGTPASKD